MSLSAWKDWLAKIPIPRMGGWAATTVALMGVIWQLAPQQAPVILYKLSLVSMAACMAYWVDRSLFKRVMDRINADTPRDLYGAARVLVRGLIFLGVVLGLSLGV